MIGPQAQWIVKIAWSTYTPIVVRRSQQSYDKQERSYEIHVVTIVEHARMVCKKIMSFV